MINKTNTWLPVILMGLAATAFSVVEWSVWTTSLDYLFRPAMAITATLSVGIVITKFALGLAAIRDFYTGDKRGGFLLAALTIAVIIGTITIANNMIQDTALSYLVSAISFGQASLLFGLGLRVINISVPVKRTRWAGTNQESIFQRNGQYSTVE